MTLSDSAVQEIAFKALDSFRIEIPSWGFANTGTRFGKFVQSAAALTLEEGTVMDALFQRALCAQLPRARPTIHGRSGRARRADRV